MIEFWTENEAGPLIDEIKSNVILAKSKFGLIE